MGNATTLTLPPTCFSDILSSARAHLCMLGKFSCFCCLLLTFFFSKLTFSKKIIQEHYKSVKTVCRSWPGPKLFAKIISRRQMAARMERVRHIQHANNLKISIGLLLSRIIDNNNTKETIWMDDSAHYKRTLGFSRMLKCCQLALWQ